MNICVVIPAAGRSTRFGASDKLAQDLGGRPLLVRTVEAFAKHDAVRSIIVAGPPEPEADYDAFRERYGPTLSFHGATVVPGGVNARWETVKAALEHVPEDATHVAVHDAARPAVSPALLDRVFEAAGTLDAVVPALDVADTVKRVSGEASDVTREDDDDLLADAILGGAGRVSIDARRVEATIERAGLVLVQTPQCFSVDTIRRAYAQDDLSGATDDASLVERLGETVHVVEGESRNVKVTVEDDIALVRALMNLKPPKERPTHLRF